MRGCVLCPKCNSETDVIDTRSAPENQTRRRRVCQKRRCKYRFTTYEGARENSDVGAVVAHFSEIERHMQSLRGAVIKLL